MVKPIQDVCVGGRTPNVDVTDTVVARQRPFSRLIAVAWIFAESTAACADQWRPAKARRNGRRRRRRQTAERERRIGRNRGSQLAVKCRSVERGGEERRGARAEMEMEMEEEKDLDVVEVGEGDGGHGDVPSAEPLDCSGSSRSSSGSNGSITPPTNLKVKQKVCMSSGAVNGQLTSPISPTPSNPRPPTQSAR